MLTRKPLVGSLYVEPSHRGLQEIVVIPRHGIVAELGDFVVGKAGHARAWSRSTA